MNILKKNNKYRVCAKIVLLFVFFLVFCPTYDVQAATDLSRLPIKKTSNPLPERGLPIFEFFKKPVGSGPQHIKVPSTSDSIEGTFEDKYGRTFEKKDGNYTYIVNGQRYPVMFDENYAYYQKDNQTIYFDNSGGYLSVDILKDGSGFYYIQRYWGIIRKVSVASRYILTKSVLDTYEVSFSEALMVTDKVRGQNGAIWSKYKLDLTKDFRFESYLYLGDEGGNAADGMTFTLQNNPLEKYSSDQSISIGSKGVGLGAYTGEFHPPNNRPDKPVDYQGGLKDNRVGNWLKMYRVEESGLRAIYKMKFDRSQVFGSNYHPIIFQPNPNDPADIYEPLVRINNQLHYLVASSERDSAFLCANVASGVVTKSPGVFQDMYIRQKGDNQLIKIDKSIGFAAYGGNDVRQGLDYIPNAYSIEFDTFYNADIGRGRGMDSVGGIGKASDKKGHLAFARPNAELYKGKSNLYQESNGLYYIVDDIRQYTGLGNLTGKNYQLVLDANQSNMNVYAKHEDPIIAQSPLSDGHWKQLTIQWDSKKRELIYSLKNHSLSNPYEFNRSKTFSEEELLSTFGGKEAYWGFTGSTGAQVQDNLLAITKLPQIPAQALNPRTTINKTNEADSEQVTVDQGEEVYIKGYFDDFNEKLVLPQTKVDLVMYLQEGLEVSLSNDENSSIDFPEELIPEDIIKEEKRPDGYTPIRLKNVDVSSITDDLTKKTYMMQVKALAKIPKGQANPHKAQAYFKIENIPGEDITEIEGNKVTAEIEDPGQLNLIVPDQLRFGGVEVTNRVPSVLEVGVGQIIKDSTKPQPEGSDHLQLVDTRKKEKRTSWQLRLKVSAPFKDNQGNLLVNQAQNEAMGIFYRQSGNGQEDLSLDREGSGQIISSGGPIDSDDGIKELTHLLLKAGLNPSIDNTVITNPDQGIVIKMAQEDILNAAYNEHPSYQADFLWQLENVPSNVVPGKGGGL